MGLNQNSQREGQTSGEFWGLLYAYEVIGKSLKKFTHVSGDVWKYSRVKNIVMSVNPHARRVIRGQNWETNWDFLEVSPTKIIWGYFWGYFWGYYLNNLL